ncbi:MAG: N-acetylglutaminylglutamine synthetase [Gammaproteobacteria bacterium]
MYVTDPHIVLAHAPQQLFLDPSDTLRLNLSLHRTESYTTSGFWVRRVMTMSDAEAIVRIYLKRHMVVPRPEFIYEHRLSKQLIYWVAEDNATGEILGTAMGVNHSRLFNDPSMGSSLWCLAVDPQSPRPGVGIGMVCYLAQYFKTRGCAYMDLSVLHDNREAQCLYKRLGFKKLPTFSIKNKNAFNENLFIGPDFQEKLNPYAQIIVDEARARGITVTVLDAEGGYFKLRRGGKEVTCRESLCDLTSAIAMSRCQDKVLTYRWLSRIDVKMPTYQLAGTQLENKKFMDECGAIVVKPSDSEQGKGITIGVETPEKLAAAVTEAQRYSDRVLLESYHAGDDLRVVVIGYRVVAAAIRKPAQVVGDGKRTIRMLIEKQSRRRAAATDGESQIPLDSVTRDCVQQKGYSLDSVLDEGQILCVRKTANLHTGGTLHDVTARLRPEIKLVSEQIARHLEIPVVGLDFIIQDITNPDYIFIEANERVGLANHEPQPTAQRFLDLLFPLSISSREPYDHAR